MLNLENLDEQVRQSMLDEVELDVSSGRLYLSPRLSGQGQHDYPNLLREAVQACDDEWLAAELRRAGRINATEQRRKPKGGYSTVSVPYTAAETMAEGEFNRFYIRALCREVIASGKKQVQVYRAKHVDSPRPDSQAKIGALVNAQTLLDDLRDHPGVDTALGLPNGPNSGLSVRRI